MQATMPRAASTHLLTPALLVALGIVPLTSPYHGLMLLSPSKVTCFSFKLATEQVLVFDWIASSSQVNLLIGAELVVSFKMFFTAVLYSLRLLKLKQKTRYKQKTSMQSFKTQIKLLLILD